MILVHLQTAFEEFLTRHGVSSGFFKILTTAMKLEIRPLAQTSKKILGFWDGSGKGLNYDQLQFMMKLAWDGIISV